MVEIFDDRITCSLDFLIDNIKKELMSGNIKISRDDQYSENYFYNGKVGIATTIVIDRVLSKSPTSRTLVISHKGEINTSEEPYCECINKVLKDKYPELKGVYLKNIEP